MRTRPTDPRFGPDGQPPATGFGARARPDGVRSGAQLRALHGLASRLNRLNDAGQIGAAVATELRGLIDHHDCRVYLLHTDGRTLVPVAFQGNLEVEPERRDGGHVSPALHMPRSPDIDGSILAVPMQVDDRVVGVIVLSQSREDRFDDHDQRLLEVTASLAAAAFENARLSVVEREAAQAAGALLELSQALTRAGDASHVLQVAFAAIPALLRGRRMGAWIREPRSGSLLLVRHRGFHPAAASSAHGGAFHAALASILHSGDPATLPAGRGGLVPPWIADPGQDVLVAPMRWEPDGQGALIVVGPDGLAFGPREVELARGIADVTSLALANARRFQELEDAYLSTVEALANALEASDAHTGDHARALAELSLAVGAEIGLHGDGLMKLELAALFHDIGKIGVSTEIIRKPGPLTAAEWREMRRHPEIGAQILAPVRFLQAIRPIVRACHERWDGRGYPDGLVGPAIPLEARVVFVCDAFHAMTTDRPYRPALSEPEAVRRLKLSSGTQFDPEVVAAFLRVHRRRTR